MELVSTSVTTHIYSIMILLIIMVFNYLSVLKTKDFLTLSQRLKFTTPLYHTSNFVVAYTGGIVAAFSHDLSITVILMLVTTIFIMILEIKRYKKMRVIRTKDCQKQNEFVIFAKKIYTMEILALLFTYIISKIF
jgi:hypothetical protein